MVRLLATARDQRIGVLLLRFEQQVFHFPDFIAGDLGARQIIALDVDGSSVDAIRLNRCRKMGQYDLPGKFYWCHLFLKTFNLQPLDRLSEAVPQSGVG